MKRAFEVRVVGNGNAPIIENGKKVKSRFYNVARHAEKRIDELTLLGYKSQLIMRRYAEI